MSRINTINSAHRTFPALALALVGASLLGGCNAESTTTPIVNGPVCEFNELNQGWAKCKEGQVLAFLPSSWGNEQLPVIATALYCDFHHPIVHTNGGVSCVYTSARKPAEAAAEEKPKAAK